MTTIFSGFCGSQVFKIDLSQTFHACMHACSTWTSFPGLRHLVKILNETNPLSSVNEFQSIFLTHPRSWFQSPMASESKQLSKFLSKDQCNLMVPAWLTASYLHLLNPCHGCRSKLALKLCNQIKPSSSFLQYMDRDNWKRAKCKMQIVGVLSSNTTTQHLEQPWEVDKLVSTIFSDSRRIHQFSVTLHRFCDFV